MTTAKILPDVAKEHVDGKPLIVGVKDVPIMRKWKSMDVLTKQSAYVKLKDERGIHASRLIRVLKEYENEELLFEHLRNNPGLVKKLKSTHDTNVSWKCKWGSIELDHLITRTIEYSDAWYMTIEVPYISICPCAAEMCKAEGEGIPHQQRSVMKITTLWRDNVLSVDKDPLPVLIRLFLMPEEIMTREQELDWCIRATAMPNLVFTEDAARRIGDALEGMDIDEYLIEVEHFESLHEHNMVAVNRKGRFI